VQQVIVEDGGGLVDFETIDAGDVGVGRARGKELRVGCEEEMREGCAEVGSIYVTVPGVLRVIDV